MLPLHSNIRPHRNMLFLSLGTVCISPTIPIVSLSWTYRYYRHTNIHSAQGWIDSSETGQTTYIDRSTERITLSFKNSVIWVLLFCQPNRGDCIYWYTCSFALKFQWVGFRDLNNLADISLLQTTKLYVLISSEFIWFVMLEVLPSSAFTTISTAIQPLHKIYLLAWNL